MQTSLQKIVPALSADKIDSKIEKIEKEDKKNTDLLVKAMVGLTKHLEGIEKRSRYQVGKDRPTIGGLIAEKTRNVARFTTLGGIAGVIADSTENRPLLGAITGSIANKLGKKEEEKRKEANFVAAVAKGTLFGRKNVKGDDDKEGLKKVGKLYKERAVLENELEAKKARRNALREEGKDSGIETDVSPEEIKEIERLDSLLRKMNETLEKGLDYKEGDYDIKTEVRKEKEDNDEIMSDEEADLIRKDLIEGIREGMREEYDALDLKEKNKIKSIPDERLKGIGEGIEQEILELSKEQLAELVKISETLMNPPDDKEDELEKRIKAPLQEEKKKEEEKSGGIFEKMFGGIKNIFKGPLKAFTSLFGKLGPLVKMFAGLIGSVGSMLAGLAPLLGPILAVAGAGAAGVAIGKGVNSLVESTTGNSIGGHIADKVDNIKGSKLGRLLGGESFEDKQKEAERKIISFKKKVRAGEEITPAEKEEMKKFGVSVESVKAMDIATKSPTTTESLQKKEGQQVSTEVEESPQESALIKLRKSEIAEANIQKMDDYREKATAAIEDMTEKEEEKRNKSSIINSTPTVVNAPSTTNNTTQNIVRPQIRNPEPTYIRLENKRFAF